MRTRTLIAALLLAAGGITAKAEAETPSSSADLDAAEEQLRTLTEAAARCDYPVPPAPPVVTAAGPAEPEFEDLLERLRAGFRLQFDSRLVAAHETFYTRRPETLARVLERSRRYLHYVVEEVERRGMPLEIALLPVIESAYNPWAYSRAHAAGLWQFIPSTGHKYGLDKDFWFEGRYDVLAATDAALTYLQDLYAMFGDWSLALGAYNMGEGGMARAIARNEAKRIPVEYDRLRLPRETANYVPKLIAVRNIIVNPSAYGISLEPMPNTPHFVKVTLPLRIDLELAARFAELSVEQFALLNPGHTKQVLDISAERPLLLPAEKAGHFYVNLNRHDQPLVTWQTYVMGRGDRIERVAARHGLTAAQLREANGLSPRARVRAGDVLVVPGAAAAGDTPQVVRVSGTSSDPAFHRVRSGDTLYSIARRYDISIDQLKRWNRLSSSRIKPGQVLRLDPPQRRQL
ncbi:MAG: LysM peptidoglycan-binding domain-containing protein [Pseudomonadota bacterium]